MKTLLASAILAALPLAAEAITLPPGEPVGGSTIAPYGSFVEVAYEPTEAMDVAFAITANGLSSDIGKVTFGFTEQGGTALDTVFTGPQLSVSAAQASLDNVSTPFSLYIVGASGIVSDIQVTITAIGTATSQVAPVPLPGAGGLLLLALAGGGLVAFRRKA